MIRKKTRCLKLLAIMYILLSVMSYIIVSYVVISNLAVTSYKPNMTAIALSAYIVVYLGVLVLIIARGMFDFGRSNNFSASFIINLCMIWSTASMLTTHRLIWPTALLLNIIAFKLTPVGIRLLIDLRKSDELEDSDDE